MPTATKNPADYLEYIIAHLDTLYEAGDNCVHPDTAVIVSDGEYDAMRRELAKLRPHSKLFEAPTASKIDSGATKIIHDPPMTSIAKASHEDYDTQVGMLVKWYESCQRELSINPDAKSAMLVSGHASPYADGVYAQSYKLDGAAIALYYERGKLIKAGLRPNDGINGEDVTEQAKFVQGIPAQLNEPVTCTIRGELICKLKDFLKVQSSLMDMGEKLRANPRNHAAGGIRQFKDPSKVKDMRLSFIAYGVESLTKPPYKTEIERAKWCNKQLGITFVQVRPFQFSDLAMMEDNVRNLDYEVDGVVISVNNLEDQEQLGRHGDKPSGNPKGKIAWKFAEERAHVVIQSIDWQTGRTGSMTPVANFSPVPLAGTQVSKATLHNFGFMKRSQIDQGTKITVLKAGKIIPKVVGVKSNPCKGDPSYPKQCSSCGTNTVIDHTPAKGNADAMWDVRCPNKKCSAQNISSLLHFLDMIGVLGLGESRVESLVSNGTVRNPSDFFKVDTESATLAGLSKRQAMLAIAGIWKIPNPDKTKEDDKLQAKIDKAQKKKISIPFWQLFAALGIESAGRSAGKELIDHFRTVEAVRNATVEELAAVEGVGSKTAQIIRDHLEEVSDEIDELLEFIEPELPKSGKFEGKRFCLSGGFDEGKKHWEKLIEDQGGKCSSSVGSKTDYLVAGPGSGSKSDKAKSLNVPIIDVRELSDMIKG